MQALLAIILTVAVVGCGPKTKSLTQTRVDSSLCIESCTEENWFNDTTATEAIRAMCEKKYEDKVCCKYDFDGNTSYNPCQ